MSKAPSMPVFTDALIGDTTHLSAEEFGAYCLILFATWRNNGQPFEDDDNRMARICRVGIKKWHRLRPTLAVFFDLSSSFWRQKRLEKEWAFVQISVAQKSAAGKASYLKRKETRSTAVTEPYQRRCQQNVNNPTPTPTKKEEREDKLSGLPANTDAAATMTTIWNEEAGGRGLIPKANNPSPARRASCLKRWREDFGSDSEQWRAYCQRVAASPHLRGENDRAWRADLDWVLMPSHMAHIIEGRYDPAPFVNGHANDGAVLHLSISPDQERRDEETKWRMLIQKWTETKRWWYDGDPPGSRWCRAPATVLAEFGFPLENGAMKL